MTNFPSQTLYQQWEAVARAHAGDLALWDTPSGRRWTFAELAREAATGEAPSAHGICHPEGVGAGFILTLLRGWRTGLMTCPVEAGGAKIAFPHLPPACAHLKITSATTGTSRIVAFTADQLQADVDHIMRGMRLSPAWANVAAISLAHSYGFSNLVLPLVLRGMPLILAGGGLPEQLRQAAKVMPAIVLPSVPALWRAWFEAGCIPANICAAISAGAPLPLALEQEVHQRLGLKIHNFYGSSECGGIAYDAADAPRAQAEYAGEALPGVEVRLTAEGCLEVRGPNVGQTYWPEAGEELGNGIFQTRDLARLERGKIFLTGRAGDQINVAGRKVQPEAIEQVLRSFPGVRECLVFGVPEAADARGEVIVAAVVLCPGANLTQVRQFALAQLPPWQMPREWWETAPLEANARGKISRAALAAQWQAATRT
jgi:acyl-coenzyme A synthetase/AMP-(fatty) acid ligase